MLVRTNKTLSMLARPKLLLQTKALDARYSAIAPKSHAVYQSISHAATPMTAKKTAKNSKNKAFMKGASLCSASGTKKRANPQGVTGYPIAQKSGLSL